MTLKRVLAVVASLALIGCGTNPPVDDEVVAEIGSALETANAFTTNAFTTNAFTTNAFTTNAFTTNAFTTNALAAIRDPGAEGTLSRSFIRYAASCALEPSQSFDFTWTDANGVIHDEHYYGELGLAPHWATGPLGDEGEQWVTACLAAHVNYYGVPVVISVRSADDPLRLHPSDPELDEYPHIEGAFWGNIWASPPHVVGCYNSANVNNSRAHLRDCATGHLNADGTVAQCGIIDVAGSCDTTCRKFHSSRGYYENCLEAPGDSNQSTDLVITTALP